MFRFSLNFSYSYTLVMAAACLFMYKAQLVQFLSQIERERAKLIIIKKKFKKLMYDLGCNN